MIICFMLFNIIISIYFRCRIQQHPSDKTGILTLGTNDKAGPLWVLQIGNRENAPMSSRGLVISHNSIDSANSQLMNDAIMEYVKNQNVMKNSLLPLVELNGHYYYFEKYFKSNYIKAMQYCREHGMDLLSIETGVENIEIIAYLKKNYPKVERFWTSGTDMGEEGSFVWLSTGRPLNFTSWCNGQPDNGGKNEHCLAIQRLGVENYVWNDRSCLDEYNFICEVKQ
ncbi:perlucin-like isoform X2 [Harmonia axyridis]|uniref:perlucin-like isoform X2 n=1 Tax=Harmonia axyridis TaxID=115357 RepID=UPI001E2768C9|nr:perlucin-like isoform X2 [Harmonia axyridis]